MPHSRSTECAYLLSILHIIDGDCVDICLTGSHLAFARTSQLLRPRHGNVNPRPSCRQYHYNHYCSQHAEGKSRIWTQRRTTRAHPLPWLRIRSQRVAGTPACLLRLGGWDSLLETLGLLLPMTGQANAHSVGKGKCERQTAGKRNGRALISPMTARKTDSAVSA